MATIGSCKGQNRKEGDPSLSSTTLEVSQTPASTASVLGILGRTGLLKRKTGNIILFAHLSTASRSGPPGTSCVVCCGLLAPGPALASSPSSALVDEPSNQTSRRLAVYLNKYLYLGYFRFYIRPLYTNQTPIKSS